MVGSPQVIVHSTHARPYTWALAACLASLLGLARWLETGSRRHGLLFSISLALCVHLHLLFLTFAVVPAFLLTLRARRGLTVDWRGLSRWLAVTALLIVPLAPQLLASSRLPDRSAYGLPPLGEALKELLPVSVLLSLVAFVFLLLPTRGQPLRALRRAPVRLPLALAAFWLLVPPLLLLVASHLSHRTLFVERYFVHTIAAQALIVAVLFREFPETLRTIGLAACFLVLPIREGIHVWSGPDSRISWRSPLQTIRRLDPAGVVPVFVQSGHPSTNATDWPHGIERGEFFWSPLVAYPLPNPAYPLPYTLDDSVPPYVRRLAESELARAPSIFVVGLARHPILQWVRDFFVARGYTATLPVHDGFWVLTLRRSPLESDNRP
jgi:hypothetical protein